MIWNDILSSDLLPVMLCLFGVLILVCVAGAIFEHRGNVKAVPPVSEKEAVELRALVRNMTASHSKLADALVLFTKKLDGLVQERQKLMDDIKWCKDEIARINMIARKWEGWISDREV